MFVPLIACGLVLICRHRPNARPSCDIHIILVEGISPFFDPVCFTEMLLIRAQRHMDLTIDYLPPRTKLELQDQDGPHHSK